MKTANMLAKARRSAASAKLLLDAGDRNGACNRAYYAMFDAARVALIASKEPVQPEAIKTHSGLITAFSLHLIKPGRIPMQYGKSLRRVDQIRLIADYSDEEVDAETASAAVAYANHFVEAVDSYLRALPS